MYCSSRKTSLICIVPENVKNLSHGYIIVNHRSKLIFAYRKFEVCLFTKDIVGHVFKTIPHKAVFIYYNYSKYVIVNFFYL